MIFQEHALIYLFIYLFIFLFLSSLTPLLKGSTVPFAVTESNLFLKKKNLEMRVNKAEVGNGCLDRA